MAGRARLYAAFAVAVAAIACYWELQDPRDHYAALGVSRSATTKEIRAGYKAKALLYHPDKVMSRRFAPWYVRLWRLATKGEARCARRFILASEAVETLADDEQRQIYDVELEARESADRQDRSRRRGQLVQRLDGLGEVHVHRVRQRGSERVNCLRQSTDGIAQGLFECGEINALNANVDEDFQNPR